MRYPKYLFVLLLLGIIYIACEKTDDSVIDPTLTFPQIDEVVVTPGTFDSDTIRPVVVAKVTSQEQVDTVTATIVNPDNQVLWVYILKDDGVLPDTTAGDGRYTGQVNEVLACRLIGTYSVEFVAENVSGNRSPVFPKNFEVTRTGNLPPSITQLIVNPDSLRANDTADFRFRLVATDPNGSCDIREVFYTGTNPNGGNLTRTNLFDDGSCCPIGNFGPSGDSTAGDAIYTRLLRGFTPLTGYFRYQFRAIDRTGDTSNILTDSIYIYP